MQRHTLHRSACWLADLEQVCPGITVHCLGTSERIYVQILHVMSQRSSSLATTAKCRKLSIIFSWAALPSPDRDDQLSASTSAAQQSGPTIQEKRWQRRVYSFDPASTCAYCSFLLQKLQSRKCITCLIRVLNFLVFACSERCNLFGRSQGSLAASSGRL